MSSVYLYQCNARAHRTDGLCIRLPSKLHYPRTGLHCERTASCEREVEGVGQLKNNPKVTRHAGFKAVNDGAVGILDGMYLAHVNLFELINFRERKESLLDEIEHEIYFIMPLPGFPDSLIRSTTLWITFACSCQPETHTTDMSTTISTFP